MSQPVGYVGFLSLLIGHLPADQMYTADAGRWSASLKWLRDRFGGKHPELFRGIHFNEHRHFQPYSPQVSEVLTLVQQGGIVEVLNPGYRCLRLRPDAQVTLKERMASKTSPKVEKTIREFAAALVQKKKDLLFEAV